MTITLFNTQKHKTLTILSFRAGSISSILGTIIFGTLAGRDWRFFFKLKTRSSHMTVCGLCTKVGYENSSEIAPEVLYCTLAGLYARS
jgi:hypothetical protein